MTKTAAPLAVAATASPPLARRRNGGFGIKSRMWPKKIGKRLMRKAAAIAALQAIALIFWTKVVWQSGFDQGSDVTPCVSAYFESGKDPKTLKTDGGCRRASVYRANPLWALRRRGSQ
jgi:hypothetical protein